MGPTITNTVSTSTDDIQTEANRLFFLVRASRDLIRLRPPAYVIYPITLQRRLTLRFLVWA